MKFPLEMPYYIPGFVCQFPYIKPKWQKLYIRIYPDSWAAFHQASLLLCTALLNATGWWNSPVPCLFGCSLSSVTGSSFCKNEAVVLS